MVKVYFDWNVMAQMKNGLHSELMEIVFDNDKFFKPYSTSHIGDIFASFKETNEQTELINGDLEFISKLTKDTFLFVLRKPPALQVVMFCGLCLNLFIKHKHSLLDISIFACFRRALPDVFQPTFLEGGLLS